MSKHKKITKDAANYVDHPVTGKECASCVMFRRPDKCTLVKGKISPTGHCRYWEPK